MSFIIIIIESCFRGLMLRYDNACAHTTIATDFIATNGMQCILRPDLSPFWEE